MRTIKFHPSLIVLVVLWLIAIAMGVMGYLSEEASRIRLAQRLGVRENMSHDEMIEYYDCSYVPVGIHASDLLERVSQIDNVLVTPLGTHIPFQSRDIEVLDEYPRTMTIHYNEFSFFDRAYNINTDGIVLYISEPATAFATKMIYCPSDSPE